MHSNSSFSSVPDNNGNTTLISKPETISEEVETIVTQKKDDITKYSIENIQYKHIESEPDYQIIANGSPSPGSYGAVKDITVCSDVAVYGYLKWMQPESTLSVKDDVIAFRMKVW